jgi:hypothetical protein
MDNQKCETDHDAIVTLVANLSNLKESQDKFHIEMKDSFRDLKDNYSGKIEAHEIRIGKLETSKTKQNTAMSIGIALLSILVSLMLYHLIK